MMRSAETTDLPLTPPTCAECGRPWLDPDDRWRSYLTDDDEPVLYCRDCAWREFGGSQKDVAGVRAIWGAARAPVST